LSNKNNQSVTPIQNHSGSGDNVSGDKISLQAISPSEIQNSLRKILTNLRHKQFTQAKNQFEALEATSNLNAEALSILQIISILIKLAEGEVTDDGAGILRSYFKIKHDEFCTDISLSAQLRLDVKNECFEDARERYVSADTCGIYTKEAFYELIADTTEIEAFFRTEKLRLDEIELCGLVRGALRLKNPEQALEISEFLHSLSPTFNSKTFITLSKACSIESKIGNDHYWRIAATLRSEILELCDEVIVLLNESNGNDIRVIGLSASLLNFVFGEYKPLADACWKNISEIEQQLPEIASQIRLLYDRSTERLSGHIYKVARARAESSYKKEIIAEITKKHEITVDDSALLGNISDAKSLRDWISNGGTISSDNQLEKDFSLLELNTLACGNKLKSKDNLRLLVDDFIKKHKTEIPNLIPTRLLQLAEKLLDLDLPFQACKLLKQHVPITDFWMSPTLCCYLKALLNSHQMMTLDELMSTISPKDWNVDLWRIKAIQQDSLSRYDDAIEAMEIAVQMAPSSSYGWYVLINLYKKREDKKTIIASILERIPAETFSQPSQYGFNLLSEMAINGNFKRAERILVDWFIKDPEGCSIPFTNAYLALITNKKEISNLSNSIGQCFGGIHCSIDGKETIKLLVDDDLAIHNNLLGISSPQGELLSRMVVGDVEQLNMFEINLIERLPPLIAAFRIAFALRQAKNDGRDCFHSFQLPEDPDEMFETLKRKLLSSDIRNQDLISNPQIPLFFKGHHQFSSSPVKSALFHLTEKRSVKHPLPGLGVEFPEKLILDVYSIIYLALTGLVKGISRSPTKLIITNETKCFFNEWLNEINRDDFFSIGVTRDGSLYRQTAEDIKKQTIEIQAAINSILTQSEVIVPKSIDLTDKILLIKDFVDLSVLSSIKLSISNDIPWLCIDEAFAQISKESGYKTVNANHFFGCIGEELLLDQKKQGLYLHVSAALPYPLTNEDVLQLSRSKDDRDHYCLAEILKMYPNAFADTGSAILFLGQILISILINAYNKKEILNGLREENPRDSGQTERVFYACCFVSMQCKDGQEAEKKLGYFLGYLLFLFQDVHSINKLIKIMASKFIAGHFLCLSAVNLYVDEIVSKIKSSYQSNNDEHGILPSNTDN